MKESDIELVMAYADGKLPPERLDEVQALIETDAQAREMLARYRQTSVLLDSAMRGVLDEPVPRQLIDTVLHHPSQGDVPVPSATWPVATPPAKDNATVPASQLAPTAANESRFWPRSAMAASVALAVGLFAGHWWARLGSDPGTDLARVLQTVPSGTQAPLADGHVMPLASFLRADGSPCREFEQTHGGRLSHGIACRAEGVWITQMLIDSGAELGRAGQPPAFVPAAGQADTLAAMAEALSLGQALSPADEERLIRRDWSQQP